MKLRVIILAFLIIALPRVGWGQGEANKWFFGNEAGLDFSNGDPFPVTSSVMSTLDNSSTVCDAYGNLLFYTNGIDVYNAAGGLMQNGAGIGGTISSGQSALIVKQIGASINYVFSVANVGGTNGLRYSTVDMTLNGGLGAVTSSNNVLYSPTTEKLAGYYSCEFGKAWLITHLWESDQFYCYSISATGLNLVPTISAVGSFHGGDTYNAMGQMTLSPDGRKLALGVYTDGFIELFDFDPMTGIVSNPINIPNQTKPWGIAFSPDQTKLYSTEWYTQNLNQFDLSVPTAAAIGASKTLVSLVEGPGANNYYQAYMELGANGKIYVAVWGDDSLAVINYPNNPVATCGFVDAGQWLGGKTSSAGLSRVVVPQDIVVLDTMKPLQYYHHYRFQFSDSRFQ